MTRPKRARGRHAALRMPDPIDAPLEEILRVCLHKAPPPDGWNFFKEAERERRRRK